MTTNEYLNLTAVIGGVIVILTAGACYLGTSKIGWKLLLVELLMIGLVGGCLYHFADPNPETIIKKRFKEKVLKAHRGCFDSCYHTCTDTCISKRLTEDGNIWLPDVPKKSE